MALRSRLDHVAEYTTGDQQPYSYLIFTSPPDVHPKRYFAKNGKTGQIDFSGTDAAAVIQQAIDNGSFIFIKEGEYDLTARTSPLTLPNGSVRVIEGAGPETILKWNSANNTSGYLIGRHEGVINGLVIRNIKIQDMRSPPAQSFGILTGWTQGETTVKDVTIDGVEVIECGIWISNVVSGRAIVKNCYVHNITEGDRGIGLNWCSHGLIYANIVDTVAEMGIGCVQNDRLSVFGNSVKDAGQKIDHACAIDISNSNYVNVFGNNIDSKYGILSENASYCVQIYGNKIVGKGISVGEAIKVWRTASTMPQADAIMLFGNQISSVAIPIRIVDEDIALICCNSIYNSNRYIEVSKNTSWGVDPTKVVISDNLLIGCGKEAWQGAINAFNTLNVEIKQNVLIGNNIANTIGIKSIGSNGRVLDNTIINYPIPMLEIQSGAIIKRNTGYITENSGTTTITAGATYVDVSHGLSITPDINRIKVTPKDNLAGRSFWVSDVGASTFRINISSSDTADHAFGWSYE